RRRRGDAGMRPLARRAAGAAAVALAFTFALATNCLAAGADPQAQARAQAQAQSPVASTPAPPTATAPNATSHGLFSDVRIVRPAGAVRQFAMLLTDDSATSVHERRLVEQLAGAGAMVAVVPLAGFWPRLEAQSGKCSYAAGAFENL